MPCDLMVSLCASSDAAPRLLQENQRYLSQLTSLMQEAADEQTKSIVVSPPDFIEKFELPHVSNKHKTRTRKEG